MFIIGPFKCNGVPLRRLNPIYCIATSVKIDVADVKIPENIDDAYFKVRKTFTKKDKKNTEKIIEKKEEKQVISDARKADQKTVDEQLLKKISAVPMLKEYISTLFTIPKGKAVHTLKF